MPENHAHLKGSRIIIGISGGIACYKIADLVSKLVQAGTTVDVVMTEAAAKFISPLTFASLTGRPVLDSQWAFVEKCDPQHIRLANEAALMLVAPCTMNMLGKLVNGLASDAVSLVVSAIDRKITPVLLAPSMNVTMLSQPATVRNLLQLENDGFKVLEAQCGWQACREVGRGRLPEPSILLKAISDALGKKNSFSS